VFSRKGFPGEGAIVGQDPRDAYLAGADPRAARALSTLDAAIRAACPELDVAIKYGLLTYGLNGDWRRWVCSLGATKQGVALRFLYGVLLDDPRGVLRSGSSVLMTWDLGFDEEADAEAVGAYVREAAEKYNVYAADERAILERARATAKPGRRPKAGS
jgi:hypothetical protein